MAAVPFLRRDLEGIDLGSTTVNASRQVLSRQIFRGETCAYFYLLDYTRVVDRELCQRQRAST
ncbi:hypothetical protein WN51_10624 [Melipona quadrifasciata]|uniref:Uncharacterized protein n=1 Tax=Melipona quadrifasciata TaxID=166423 RepID=A0A0N0BIV4_9HYME|nr:hypothetical protein WN51_10624 [Melipona quadrifasciata]